jgi:NAD(P)-dependent dehydrogenase (short-subunit alcohol dehydrogenase family)
MGEATARLLVELGAEVYGLDVNEVQVPGIATYIPLDLNKKESIEESLQRVGGPVEAVFSIAGLPGAPWSDLETMTVNFIGARYLIETAVARELLPRGSAIACVASTAGMGWEAEFAKIRDLLAVEDFEDARKWCEVNDFVGYRASKQALNAYVAWRAPDFLERGIRLNSICPAGVTTPMYKHFTAQVGKEVQDRMPRPIGRKAVAEDVSYPLAFLNCEGAAYIAGAVVYVDGGFSGGLTTGRFEFPMFGQSKG